MLDPMPADKFAEHIEHERIYGAGKASIALQIEARDAAIRIAQARADAAIARDAANAARSYGWTDRGDDLLRLAESIECRAGLPPAAGEEG